MVPAGEMPESFSPLRRITADWSWFFRPQYAPLAPAEPLSASPLRRAQAEELSYVLAASTLGLGALVIFAIHIRRYLVKRRQRQASSRATEEPEETNTSPPLDLTRPSVLSYLLETAAISPDRIALVGWVSEHRVELSYGTLATRITTVAYQLTTLETSSGAVVAVLLDRGIPQVVALLAALAADCIALPLDIMAPSDRLCHILGRTGPRTVIVDRDPGNLVAGASANFVKIKQDGSSLDIVAATTSGGDADRSLPQSLPTLVASHPAWLYFTSGSTGQPKGVVYSNSHLIHCGAAVLEGTAMTSETKMLQQSGCYWGASAYELFPTFMARGCLVVAPPNLQKDPRKLADLLVAEEVTAMCLLPKLLVLVLDAMDGQMQKAKHLRHVICTGEGLATRICERFLQSPAVSQARLHNSYGATESGTLWYTLPSTGLDTGDYPTFCPVGVPLAGAHVWIMDGNCETVQTGQVGEIFFGGQLSEGYWKDDVQTAANFRITPGFGRSYRTGDLGQWINGVVTVVGRADRQVKIRGVRVELEEVEVVACKCWDRIRAGGPKVKAACVTTLSDSPQLVLVVAPRVSSSELKALEEGCRTLLPKAYVPSHFLSLEELPTLANEKTDLRKLQDWVCTQLSSSVVVLDSLGLMRLMVREAVIENEVLQRCYVVWMMSDTLYHWIGTLPAAMPTWIVVTISAMAGPPVDVGFMWSLAFQDSRLEKGQTKPTLVWSLRDVAALLIYWLIGTLGFLRPASNGWPGMLACYRWFLRAYLQGRFVVWLFQRLEFRRWRIPAPIQVAFAVGLTLLMGQTTFDLSSLPDRAAKTLGVLFAVSCEQGACPVFAHPAQMFSVFYMLGYFYSQPVVKFLRSCCRDRFNGICSCFAAGMLYIAISFLISMWQPGMEDFTWATQGIRSFKYALVVLRDCAVSFALSLLLPFALSALPFSLRWWGRGILGTYVLQIFAVQEELASRMMEYPVLSQCPPLLFLALLVPTFVQMTFAGPFLFYLMATLTNMVQRLFEKIQSKGGARTSFNASTTESEV